MKTERQLARLSNERLIAHLNYHSEAVALAAVYGRRSIKDEQALQRVRNVMETRKAKKPLASFDHEALLGSALPDAVSLQSI